ncbi:MAG: T9SS type A sorting domain-containing protein [Sulfuricurvum sp.]|nr:T9SS type A sorting domain-containing protein [Sulfuricurvum sp.]
MNLNQSIYNMKKITLFVALMCSLSAFSTRYLVQGTTGTNSWRIAGAGEINVTTSDFRAWYYATFPAGYVYNVADEIWLAGGTYTISTFFGSRKVSVYGGFAGTETSIADRSKISGGKAWEFSTPTIIDGNNTCPQGFSSNGIATTPFTYIDGITITKCQVTSGTANVSGVGAYITKGCVMQNCIVSNNTYNNTATINTFYGKGGGIYLTGGKVLDSYIANNTLTKGNGGSTYGGGVAFAYTSESALNIISGCTIENNSSTTFGGGMEVINGTGGTIENCIFKTNTCTAGEGGGLGSTNSNAAGTSLLSIKNCQFIENTAATQGGGAEIQTSSTAPVTTAIEGCSFIGNSALNVGGLTCRVGTLSPIKNCIFRDNKNTNAVNSAAGASALSFTTSIATVQNCVFANNSTVTNTLGNFTIKFNGSGSKLLNCTVVNNSDPGTAGNTVMLNNSALVVINSVFWGNTATANFKNPGSSPCTYNATTSDKNTTGSTVGGTTGNITSLAASNTFVSPTTFVGIPSTIDGGLEKAASAVADWSMKSGCPSINSGADLSSSGVTTDISGNTRPTGSGKVDIGAYEYISYQSNTSGNWGDYSTWQLSADGSTFTSLPDATYVPTSSMAGSVSILNGHTVTVAANATSRALNVNAGGKLTLNNEVTLSTIALNLMSDPTLGTGTFVDQNTNGGLSVTGTTTVNQSLQPASAVRTWYITPPVASVTPTPALSIIKYFDETFNDPTPANNWVSSSTMVAKVGYQVVPVAGNDISFSGTLNNGNQDITLTSRAGTVNKAGFNLIGNPYPSYLDWNLVTANSANSALMRSTTMWYRTKTAGVYSFWTVNGDGVSSPNGASSLIPPMQAFWVRANGGGGTLALTNGMRSHAPVADMLLKAPASKKTANTLVRLQVSNGINTDEAVIYFSANASNGMDVNDAPKMSNDNVDIPEIYTTVGAEQIVINGMNTIPLDTPIGLGFVPGNASSFRLTANEISNLPTDLKVILKDNVTKTETDLTDGVSIYQFSPVVTSSDRFSVIFRSNGTVTSVETPQDNSILVYSNAPQQLIVMCNNLHLGSMLSVYTAIGQKLVSQQLTSTSTQIGGKFTPGVYMVKVNNTTKKVIIN